MLWLGLMGLFLSSAALIVVFGMFCLIDLGEWIWELKYSRDVQDIGSEQRSISLRSQPS